MTRLLSIIAILIIACSPAQEKPQLLLISFDGFRADYLTKTETPSFDKLVETGVTSEGLIPVFPTKTFPNHYAIVTGLYPENNGLVGNNMYDPEMDARYSIGNRDAVENPVWYSGEPIWNTVEKAGKTAGTMFWVGSEAPIQDMRPTHWKRYDGSVPNSARVDTVLKWMTRENSPVDFGTLYFSFTDSRGHRYGPDSPEIVQAIQDADSIVGYLIEQLSDLDPNRNINLMIVSDHGMIEVSPERKVVLDDYVDVELLEFIEYSPSLMFNVEDGYEEEIYSALKAEEENFRIYKKEDIPDRFHLKNSKRMPEFLMIANEGYTINAQEFFQSRGENYPSGGAHGFDNANPKMHAIFIAHGPAFKEGLKMEPFVNINLYEVMANILEVTPAENDGDFDSIKQMLR